MSEVAVIVPAHDSAAFLGEALDSVFRQTLAPEEIIVIDDGSKDDTAAVAQRHEVRCIVQANRGPAAARNRGIAATKAPLLAFLDADDIFAPCKLERQVDEIERTGAVLCSAEAFILRDGVRGARKVGKKMPRGGPTLEDLMRGNPIICSSVLARRNAVERAGGFDEDPTLIATEDYDLWLRLADLGRLVHVDEPLLDYREHRAGLSDDLRFVAGIDRIMEKVRCNHADRPGFSELIARRRAGVRTDAAFGLVRQGQGRRARALLSEARGLGHFGWPEIKIWLRSLLARE